MDQAEDAWLWADFIDNLTYNDNNSYDYLEGDVCDLSNGTVFESLFIPTLYSVAFVVGVLGNGLLLGVLFQSRKHWSVTDIFILHLAVSDVLLLFILPFRAGEAASKVGWEFGSALCKITGTVLTINFYCGIFLLACISVDRYLSIVHATQMYNRRKSWVVHVSCMLVWLFSVVLSIPDWIFLEVSEDSRQDRKTCARKYLKYSEDDIMRLKIAARSLYHVVGFLFPSFVLIFCYTCILLQLQCGSRSLQKQRAFKVIISVVAVFFVCWTPFNIVLLADTIQTSNNTETCDTTSSLGKAMTVTLSLGYLHCSLNPILYAFVGVKFRRQLLNILKSMGCKLKTNIQLESFTRRSSIWSDSGEASNSIAI
ncbi:C-X-C chemokine receptor type 3-like [Poeciliopsis prolifica]|uniref:C-X-C chemokine receptor type 3-like n=1 Tax=Poeciliopsis prolifica TaxID=188132 RepID=UPI002412F56F|nr:C-X-C chemokine receptor type 3-like [Poeciliopsis prolifica]XP_054903910.1 C-X-C chemokine receptor type 3-like [Poeciliopsis prolifica]XP_054903911.1 C-X-C chemokine receptor type 3-like [Poeciliopsis prolifica]